MKKQLDTGTYKINTEQKTKENIKNKITYTLFGNHIDLLDGYPILSSSTEKDAYAVSETNNNKTTYFIQIDNYNNLFNPIDLAPSKGTNFIKVNEKCFNQYLQFLKSRNVLYLKFAEQARI